MSDVTGMLLQVFDKVKHQDEELKKHITELLEELGPGMWFSNPKRRMQLPESSRCG